MHRPYILFLLAALATAAPAAGIYEVSRDGRTLFLLGGTIHVLPADERTLPQPYAEALQQADALCLETDMVALESPAFVSEMLDAFQYDDGQSLQSSLGAAAYESLSDHSERYGIPIASMEPFKPGFALLTIELTHYIQMDMSPPGLDQLLQNQAVEQGKTLCPLETPEQQLQHLVTAIGDMSDAEVIQAVEQSQAQGDDWLQSFLDKWRRGDMEDLDAMARFMMDSGDNSYHHLIRLRNDAWMRRLIGPAPTAAGTAPPLADTPELEFIAVGSAHLGGPDGLIPQLRRAGYRVTRR